MAEKQLRRVTAQQIEMGYVVRRRYEIVDSFSDGTFAVKEPVGPPDELEDAATFLQDLVDGTQELLEHLQALRKRASDRAFSQVEEFGG